MKKVKPSFQSYKFCEKYSPIEKTGLFHWISKIFRYLVVELLMGFPRFSQKVFFELLLKANLKFENQKGKTKF